MEHFGLSHPSESAGLIYNSLAMTVSDITSDLSNEGAMFFGIYRTWPYVVQVPITVHSQSSRARLCSTQRRSIALYLSINLQDITELFRIQSLPVHSGIKFLAYFGLQIAQLEFLFSSVSLCGLVTHRRDNVLGPKSEITWPSLRRLPGCVIRSVILYVMNGRIMVLSETCLGCLFGSMILRSIAHL